MGGLGQDYKKSEQPLRSCALTYLIRFAERLTLDVGVTIVHCHYRACFRIKAARLRWSVQLARAHIGRCWFHLTCRTLDPTTLSACQCFVNLKHISVGTWNLLKRTKADSERCSCKSPAFILPKFNNSLKKVVLSVWVSILYTELHHHGVHIRICGPPVCRCVALAEQPPPATKTELGSNIRLQKPTFFR